MTFRYAGASATGKGHLDTGTDCEDAWRVTANEYGIVACVCDGAGSASRSAEGARCLADAVCEGLICELENLDSQTIIGTLAEAIENTRRALAERGPLSDFHATLCGVAMGHDQSVVFHLGDGIVLGTATPDWEDFVVSEPENGDFAETTYFFTLPDWRRHLRIFSVPGKYRSWFLMSDGTASFAVKTAPWRPTSRFLVPIHRYLLNQTNDTECSQALMSTLQSPEADRITADDKTLVWLNDQRQN
ncbi:protein phosphatase 2C domain-containing protein [Marinobacter daepoensis]|uniref:PP2C family serine/threonine-protein phosphatase n=1 Tax=Marinobacter daepoensis TaxID=262077 RepID=UPI001C988B40|nr:PP2C family serine/threonine-protein phosphatase [Marinobacter daepoensis]MBY6032225.1 protein phosphatase 2C domain-containing protein [Marinobacter daepoensis]